MWHCLYELEGMANIDRGVLIMRDRQHFSWLCMSAELCSGVAFCIRFRLDGWMGFKRTTYAALVQQLDLEWLVAIVDAFSSPQITSSNLMSNLRGGFQSFFNIFCALQVSFCFNKMLSETAFRIVMLGTVMLLSICRAQLRCRCPPDMSPKDMH